MIILKNINILLLLTECLANFLCGEGRLESFLEQTPPIEANQAKAKAGLMETKRYLLQAANEKEKQVAVILSYTKKILSFREIPQ